MNLMIFGGLSRLKTKGTNIAVYLFFLLIFCKSSFSQVPSFSPYIPTAPVEAMKEVGQYMEAKYNKRVEILKNELEALAELNYDKIYPYSSQKYEEINKALKSGLNKSWGDGNLADDRNWNRVDGFLKGTRNYILRTSKNLAAEIRKTLPTDASQIVAWREKLEFIPKYLTIEQLDYSIISLGEQELNDISGSIYHYLHDLDEKMELMHSMESFWNNRIHWYFISKNFEAYYTFYLFDKAGHKSFLRRKANGEAVKEFPSESLIK